MNRGRWGLLLLGIPALFLLAVELQWANAQLGPTVVRPAPRIPMPGGGMRPSLRPEEIERIVSRLNQMPWSAGVPGAVAHARSESLVEKTVEELLADGEISQSEAEDFLRRRAEYHKWCDECGTVPFDGCIDGRFPRITNEMRNEASRARGAGRLQTRLCRLLKAKETQGKRCLEQRQASLQAHPRIAPLKHQSQIQERANANRNVVDMLRHYCENMDLLAMAADRWMEPVLSWGSVPAGELALCRLPE